MRSIICKAVVLVGFAAVAVAALVMAGCGSLPKARLERELLGLAKNAPIAELKRRSITADLGHGEQVFELVFTHARAARQKGKSVPVLLVHGTPSTLFSWVDVIHGGPDFEGLASTRDVYAIEVVGHGVAPGDASPYDFERCARFVAAAARGLGLERVHLVGSSYGGEFAWRAALNEPELVASLVLIDSSGFARREGDWLPEEVEMRENPLAKIGWILNSRDRIRTALAPHFDPIPPDRVDEFFLVCDNSHNWKAMVELARDENGSRAAELAELQAPTLVLWGRDDVAYPVEVYGERFAREIPDAELVVMPGCGHYPHEARPDAVVRELDRFFGANSD